VSSYEIGNKARLLDGRLQVNTSAFYIDWVNMQFNQTLSCGLAFVNNAGHAISKGAEVQANGRFGDWSLGANIGYDNAVFADPVKTASGTLVQAKGDNVGVPDWTISLNGQYDFRIMDMPGFIRADYNYTGKYQRGPGPGASAYNAYTYQGAAFDVWNARAGVTYAKVDWALFVQNLANAKPMIGYAGGTNTTTDSLRNTGSSIRPRMVGVQANYRF
jgi:outer membrane receptor for ferric coprogen and ferric-rhodotorulic acid